jgi:UDP-N-acetylmuramoylalanine--D-glutamate ligase
VTILSDVLTQRLAIWGGGLEARSALKRLIQLGATDVCVAIDRPGKDPAELAKVVAQADVEIHLGLQAEKALVEADFVIASPSIPSSNGLWSRLSAVETTTNLWMAQFGRRAIAVTGSKGKSTTTKLLGELLETWLPGVEVGGNIGVPFFDLDPSASTFVVEIGSPQCERLSSSPAGGAITALFPEHLDHHGSLEAYYSSKANLFRHGSNFVVTTENVLSEYPPIGQLPGLRLVPDADLTLEQSGLLHTSTGSRQMHLSASLRGSHNLTNVNICLGILQQLGYDPLADVVAQRLSCFQGLPHRLETVRRVGALTWIDDSLATAPQPTEEALNVFVDEYVYLIVGGLDRGVDYAPLGQAVARHGKVRAIFAIPQSGVRIADEVQQYAPSTPVYACESIQEAVSAVAAIAVENSVVLFSPASPSTAEHVSYLARSQEFISSIDAL